MKNMSPAFIPTYANIHFKNALLQSFYKIIFLPLEFLNKIVQM